MEFKTKIVSLLATAICVASQEDFGVSKSGNSEFCWIGISRPSTVGVCRQNCSNGEVLSDPHLTQKCRRRTDKCCRSEDIVRFTKTESRNRKVFSKLLTDPGTCWLSSGLGYCKPYCSSGLRTRLTVFGCRRNGEICCPTTKAYEMSMERQVSMICFALEPNGAGYCQRDPCSNGKKDISLDISKFKSGKSIQCPNGMRCCQELGIEPNDYIRSVDKHGNGRCWSHHSVGQCQPGSSCGIVEEVTNKWWDCRENQKCCTIKRTGHQEKQHHNENTCWTQDHHAGHCVERCQQQSSFEVKIDTSSSDRESFDNEKVIPMKLIGEIADLDHGSPPLKKIINGSSDPTIVFSGPPPPEDHVNVTQRSAKIVEAFSPLAMAPDGISTTKNINNSKSEPAKRPVEIPSPLMKIPDELSHLALVDYDLHSKNGSSDSIKIVGRPLQVVGITDQESLSESKKSSQIGEMRQCPRKMTCCPEEEDEDIVVDRYLAENLCWKGNRMGQCATHCENKLHEIKSPLDVGCSTNNRVCCYDEAISNQPRKEVNRMFRDLQRMGYCFGILGAGFCRKKSCLSLQIFMNNPVKRCSNRDELCCYNHKGCNRTTTKVSKEVAERLCWKESLKGQCLSGCDTARNIITNPLTVGCHYGDKCCHNKTISSLDEESLFRDLQERSYCYSTEGVGVCSLGGCTGSMIKMKGQIVKRCASKREVCCTGRK